jgi:hypothetical protein
MVTPQYGRRRLSYGMSEPRPFTCHIILWQTSTFSTLCGSLNEGMY